MDSYTYGYTHFPNYKRLTKIVFITIISHRINIPLPNRKNRKRIYVVEYTYLCSTLCNYTSNPSCWQRQCYEYQRYSSCSFHLFDILELSSNNEGNAALIIVSRKRKQRNLATRVAMDPARRRRRGRRRRRRLAAGVLATFIIETGQWRIAI